MKNVMLVLIHLIIAQNANILELLHQIVIAYTHTNIKLTHLNAKVLF